MKIFSRVIIICLLTIVFKTSFSQGINFQGVARSANGTILASQKIGLKLSILTGTNTSTPDYVETRVVSTNAQGIFSVVIGDTGTLTTMGTYANINWKTINKFLKVDMDPAGGTSFISMGTTPLQYVPFSYYSNGVDAANVSGTLAVNAGGTGVSTLDSLKMALKIPSFDTTSLSNRINTLDTKIKNQASLFSTLNIQQYYRDTLKNLNPGSIIWCTNCGAAGELQVYNGQGWKNIIGGNVAKATPLLDSTSVKSITGHSADATSYVLFSDDGINSGYDGGFCWGTNAAPVIGSSNRSSQNWYPGSSFKKDSFALSSTILNLTKNTKYYIRSFATNQIGTAYGPEKIFFTNNNTSAPLNVSTYPNYIVVNKAAFSVNVGDAGGEPIIESGIDFADNSSFNAKTRVNTKNSNGEFVINSLVPNKKYYIRPFARNIVGETLGDGSSYFYAIDMATEQLRTTVQIGTKTWTARNLDVFNYRNGDPIPLVTDSATWANLTTGAYTYYNNDSVNYGYLGKIYNWFAVNDTRGLAPLGWHLPTTTEVDLIIKAYNPINGALTNLNGIMYNGSANPTNTSGFSALSPGIRQLMSVFPDFIGFNWNLSFFWCKDDYAWSSPASHNYRARFLFGTSFIIVETDNSYANSFAKSGMYVRLIKD